MIDIQERIKLKGYTLYGFAKELGVHYYTLRRTLDGATMPRKQLITDMAEKLGVDRHKLGKQILDGVLNNPTSEGT